MILIHLRLGLVRHAVVDRTTAAVVCDRGQRGSSYRSGATGVHRWEVTKTAVYTQTGWWTRERRIAPMSRIQTVDYAEGAIARLFGLASVTVTTASAAGALEIAGLDKSSAPGTQPEELTLSADTVEGDAT